MSIRPNFIKVVVSRFLVFAYKNYIILFVSSFELTDVKARIGDFFVVFLKILCTSLQQSVSPMF